MLNRLQESDIKLLRVFFAVASCNGFTAAEPVLRMQRPNISAAIKKLEERLDLILCHRGRGGFQMTKEGEVVFQETKRIFNAFDNFVFNLKSLHDDYSGHLTIVLMSGLPMNVVRAVSKSVKTAMNKFEDIHFNVQTRLYNEVEHASTSGECHLVVSCYDMVKPESIIFHPLPFKCTGQLYCAKTHPLAKHAGQLPDSVDMEDYPAIGITGMSPSNYIGNERRMAIETFSDSFESCLPAILTGEYIGLLPDYFVQGKEYEAELVALAGDEFKFSHNLYVMNGKNTRMNPVLKHFVRELEYFVTQ